MTLRRIDMLQDCLAVLSTASMADARAVIDVLAHMSTWGQLPTLFVDLQAPDATAAVRHDAAAIAMAVHVQSRVDAKEPTTDEPQSGGAR